MKKESKLDCFYLLGYAKYLPVNYCGETHRQKNESHSTEHEEFKTHPRL
jgi:hypothetical protein